MRIPSIANLGILLALTAGFRAVTGDGWDVSRDQPTIWIELDEKLYAGDGFGDKVDNVKGMLGSLKGLPASDQRSEIWRIILADFASVETSFLRLRLKPGQIDSIDADNDPESENYQAYDEEYAKTRTIKIKVGASVGAASGFASLAWGGSNITGCDITIAPSALGEPNFYTHVLAHEILHCLGLDHQQDDADSLMSYSNNSVGLSIEERMALTHLYPLEPKFAKESPTLGLACEPAK